MPERSQKAQGDVDPSQLAETLADAPAIRAERTPPPPSPPPRADRPPPPPSPAPRADPSDSALADTAVDMDADAAQRKEDGVELASVFDQPDPVADAASLTRFDPEAGKTNVAIKI